MIWDKINEVAKELRAQKYNPSEIKSMMKNAVDYAVIDLINEEYTLVIFDSPEGYSSKGIIEAEGYESDWIGHPSCRGETRVYLPKDKNVKEFKKWLKEKELIDKYSVVIARNNYKNTTI